MIRECIVGIYTHIYTYCADACHVPLCLLPIHRVLRSAFCRSFSSARIHGPGRHRIIIDGAPTVATSYFWVYLVLASKLNCIGRVARGYDRRESTRAELTDR